MAEPQPRQVQQERLRPAAWHVTIEHRHDALLGVDHLGPEQATEFDPDLCRGAAQAYLPEAVVPTGIPETG